MSYNRTYQISGEASLDTTITPQADLISDIRSIEGITIVTFTPKNEEESAASNPNHVGILSIKFDTFPFTEFDKDAQINILVDQIRKMPAVNYFKTGQVNLLETRLKSLVKEMLLEKKTKRDRCLRIADRKFDKPSAYKSGAVVRCRNGSIWKGIKEGDDFDLDESLRDWFKKEDWVRIDTQGNITGPCGTMKKDKATTRCLPRAKANSLTKAERAATSRKKVAASKKGKQFVPNTDKAKVKLSELDLKKAAIAGAIALGTLGTPSQIKAQEPQQKVQQVSGDLDITSSKAARYLEKQGYKPTAGGLSIDMAVAKLQDMISKGFKIVQGKGVGETQTLAQLSASQKAKSKLEGQAIPTNIVFYRELDNGNIEVVVFLGNK
jgi:hypothetical protein